MPVDGVSSFTPVSEAMAARTAAAATPPDQFGKDTFLKLLVAQLRYQDPTNPTDGSQFLAQTAQFTTVEKLNEMAQLGGESLAAQQVLSASSLVGRGVTYAGDAGDVTGTVTAARLTADGPVLTVRGSAGTQQVPVAQVKEVRATSA